MSEIQFVTRCFAKYPLGSKSMDKLMYFLTFGLDKATAGENLYEHLLRTANTRGLIEGKYTLKENLNYPNQELKRSYSPSDLEDFFIGLSIAIQANNIEKVELDYKDKSSYMFDSSRGEHGESEAYIAVNVSSFEDWH